MSRVIQIRDVPDEVHEGLAEAAEAEGISMSKYVRRELEQVAGRTRRARENAAVLHRTQKDIGVRVDRETILSVLHDGRG